MQSDMLVLIVVCFVLPGTGLYAAAQSCPVEKANFPHERDCEKYYRCVHGHLVVMECEKGLLYYKKYGICFNENFVQCGNLLTPKQRKEIQEQKELERLINELWPTDKPGLTTTDEMITEEPRIKELTTEEFTTENPTIEESTTKEATTKEAITKEATTEATTESLTTEEATTEETTIEEATTEEATTEETTTEEATTMEPVSLTEEPPYEDFHCPTQYGMYPHPSNPRWFYSCQEYFPHTLQCPASLLFNPIKSVCDFKLTIR